MALMFVAFKQSTVFRLPLFFSLNTASRAYRKELIDWLVTWRHFQMILMRDSTWIVHLH